MSYTASFGLPDGVPELASALEITKTIDKHVIKNSVGVSSKVHHVDPKMKYSMTVEAVDSSITAGDGSSLSLPGLPDGGFNSLDEVKIAYKQDGNSQQVMTGEVLPEATSF